MRGLELYKISPPRFETRKTAKFMPRLKSQPKEFFFALDRMPERERLTAGLRKHFSSIAEFYGFEPITPSIVEDPKIFQLLGRAGFFEERAPCMCKTKNGDEIMLRFSSALSILRMYITHGMSETPHPIKFSFCGDAFFIDKKSGDKDNAVRMLGGVANISECGLIMIGDEGPVAEAQIIQSLWKAFESGKVPMEYLEVVVNATGCQNCRSSFQTSLTAYFRNRASRLCKGCKRIFKRIPTKIFRCREEQCRAFADAAPQVLDFLCDPCKKHLRGFLEFLEEVKIPYTLDSKFFRDDSWYQTFIFEFSWKKPAASKEEEGNEERKTLAEGGRISRAGELLWGKKLDAVSGSIILQSVEKLLKEGGAGKGSGKRRIFVAHLGDFAKRKSMTLLETLRAHGVEVHESLGRDSIKSQLKIAERLVADIALILGQKEALDSTIIVREMESGIQETIPQEKLIEFLARKLKK